MQNSQLQTLVMPGIDDVTITYQELNFLRPEILLDFVSVTDLPILFVTPLAILHSTIGVLQSTPLRQIPVGVAGRLIYPVSSQSLPWLHSRLTINADARRLRFQGNFIPPFDGRTHENTKLIGLALTFTTSSFATDLCSSGEEI